MSTSPPEVAPGAPARAEERPPTRGPGLARARFKLGHLFADPVDLAGALDAIEVLVDRGQGGAVFTPNVDHFVVAERREDFRGAYAAADLSLADGKPVVWASRLLGEPLPAKVSGSDLVMPLMDRAASKGWRVFLCGGPPGVAEIAAERLRARGVAVVGTAAPFVPADLSEGDPEGDQAAAVIRAAQPHLVVVGFGAPKQELWIASRLAELRPTVLLGLGASIDFLAGRARRAPAWVSHAGLEWLWRLAHEPRRLWRRYLVQDPAFAGIVWRELRRRRRP